MRNVQISAKKAEIQGQPLKEEKEKKKIREVAEIKKKLDLPNLEILLDIGVTVENVRTVVQAGATGVTPGSLLWKSQDIQKTVQQLRINGEV